MTTATQAFAAIREAMETSVPANPKAGGAAITYRWLGEDAGPLPNVASPFVFTLFSSHRSSVIENGGGRGANRHRQSGEADIFVFIPNDWGQKYGTDIAEHFAELFRSYCASGVAVDDVTVYPGGPGSEIAVPGLDSEVNKYIWCGCGVSFHFDLIG